MKYYGFFFVNFNSIEKEYHKIIYNQNAQFCHILCLCKIVYNFSRFEYAQQDKRIIFRINILRENTLFLGLRWAGFFYSQNILKQKNFAMIMKGGFISKLSDP